VLTERMAMQAESINSLFGTSGLMVDGFSTGT
jgi:hypothetical protein